MKYHISLNDIDWSKNRWFYKGSVPWRERKGYIGLFDRNIQKFIWFRIIEKCDNKLAYIVERSGHIPLYWKKALSGLKEGK